MPEPIFRVLENHVQVLILVFSNLAFASELFYLFFQLVSLTLLILLRLRFYSQLPNLIKKLANVLFTVCYLVFKFFHFSNLTILFLVFFDDISSRVLVLPVRHLTKMLTGNRALLLHGRVVRRGAPLWFVEEGGPRPIRLRFRFLFYFLVHLGGCILFVSRLLIAAEVFLNSLLFSDRKFGNSLRWELDIWRSNLWRNLWWGWRKLVDNFIRNVCWTRYNSDVEISRFRFFLMMKWNRV